MDKDLIQTQFNLEMEMDQILSYPDLNHRNIGKRGYGPSVGGAGGGKLTGNQLQRIWGKYGKTTSQFYKSHLNFAWLQIKEVEIWEHVLKWGLAKSPDPKTWSDDG
ncbi:hypothetical protein GLOIN_2v1773891 [Rhizophagus irregularis DAOM 181602=DAOM 197198]|uniref:Uncharacterized protein n=1 Tax=Rhizophagus irregularis (strain DAOM 181602 / DAOM 197198 / MUCL 43194) TaxID=747089 RepID=U9TBH2_RHIID|nr:hypothetical protein GLOIN_2v1773891 [Rhizophagus irregularis DAOM 181602=DAOM 197198]POG72224.1 hypothetical protein GLOIN_2v1773891 [Rhizophagus irregularis DAOM 181602=DAOM 197198]GBC39384.1 hypothetical protein GLOIN_2v1773891 [Rhizophagus irregularis DAOM 181602=DAOM 197198]|eukprot:XP_025179090.1 hypothetical protein GLOIN_2v1773891 [Rhizophagus irregularis DAOM 181602=DAOM 197198]